MNRVEEAWRRLMLNEKRHTQRDLVRATGVPAVTLQNWVNRKIFVPTVDAPGKSKKRLYSSNEVFEVALAAQLVGFGIPPHPAFNCALSLIVSLWDDHYKELLAAPEEERPEIKFWPENDGEVFIIFQNFKDDKAYAFVATKDDLLNFRWSDGPVLVLDVGKTIVQIADKLCPAEGAA